MSLIGESRSGNEKRSVCPQDLVDPQHIEGYFEGGGQSNQVLLSPENPEIMRPRY